MRPYGDLASMEGNLKCNPSLKQTNVRVIAIQAIALSLSHFLENCGALQNLDRFSRGGYGWDTSIDALKLLNSHPLLYNTALETAHFVGPT
jgi:hypothetical protein